MQTEDRATGGVSIAMKKGDTSGKITVDGDIVGKEGVDGTREYKKAPIWIMAHNQDARPYRGDGSDYYTTSDTGCLRITGSGTVDVEIRIMAMGNFCVDLKRVGRVAVAGSIVERGGDADATTRAGKNITTDVFFKNEVVLDGDLEQWNDARVVFEKGATIRGDMILDDGAVPDDIFRSSVYGAARDASVRKGVQMGGSSSNYTCEYVTGKSAAHIPGVQFMGVGEDCGGIACAIKYAHKRSSQCCQGQCSIVCSAGSIHGSRGKVHYSHCRTCGIVFHWRGFSRGGHGRAFTARGGCIWILIWMERARQCAGRCTMCRWAVTWLPGGNTIGMASPSTSSMDGMCTGKDTFVDSFGNHLVLTDAAESVIIGDKTNGLTLGALVTRGDLRVESGKGPLTVTDLACGFWCRVDVHQGCEGDGVVDSAGRAEWGAGRASTIKKLTYGSRTTDVVKKASLVTMLDALAIHVGSGELRLDEMYQTKNLGLCSGTLSLVDVESTTDSTLHVTEQITVQNGMLVKDTNDPGSISTDKAKSANILDRYVLTYITPGKRTVTDALEWFDPQDVIVNHAKAEITASGDRSIMGKLTITKGKLIVDGELTVGTSTLNRKGYSGNVNVQKYSVLLTSGALETKGQDVMVHGRVTVEGKSKLVTGGGDLHVLGRVEDGEYAYDTAQVLLLNKDAVVDLGRALCCWVRQTRKSGTICGMRMASIRVGGAA